MGLAGALLAVLVGWQFPGSFTSTVDVMLSPLPANALTPDSVRSGDQIYVAMQTESGLVTSPPVALIVSETTESDVEAGDDNVQASVPPNTQMVRISYAADSAETAREFADSYARALLEYRSNKAEDSIETQLELLRDQEQDASRGLRKAAASTRSGESPDAAALVQLYTNRLSALQEQIGSLEATTVNPGTIVTPADLPRSSDGVPAPFLVASGLFIGALLGVAVALWREHSDDRIRATVDGTVDTLPVMGIVPLHGSSNHGGSAAEAYRTVRAVLLASARPPATIVVSSFDDSMTHVAQQVAMSTASALSTSGYRVCLVDASLTAGPLSNLPLGTGAGFGDALASGSSARVVSLPDEGYDVVPRGRVSEATREQFGGSGLRALLQNILGRYDYVFLAGPAMSTPEASELALAADGVVTIAADRRTKIDVLRHTTRRAEQLGIDLLGVIAVTMDIGGNDADQGNPSRRASKGSGRAI